MPTFVREREIVYAYQWDGKWAECMRWLDELEVAGRFVVPFGKLPPVRIIDRAPGAGLVVDHPGGGSVSCPIKDWVVLDEVIKGFYVAGDEYFKAHYKHVQDSTERIDTSTAEGRKEWTDKFKMALADREIESDGDLLARLGTDGMKWAEEFLKLHGAKPIGVDTLDLFHGWFANAIEAGRSAGYSRGQDDAIRDQAYKG